LKLPVQAEAVRSMNEVTRILSAIDQGDPHAAAQLLPLVYEELRQLAAAQMAREKPGQTLDATALVHEAYLRLVGDQHFDNRRHFSRRLQRPCAASSSIAPAARNAETWRRPPTVRIAGRPPYRAPSRRPPAGHRQSPGQLAEARPALAELVKLRYVAQLTLAQAAELLGHGRVEC
jgi:hypothetical protein